VVYFFANLDLGVGGLGLRVLLALLDGVAGLVGQVKGENSSELLLCLLTMGLDAQSASALAGVMLTSQIVGRMAPVLALPFGEERVISFGESPDNAAWLTHLLQLN